MDKQRRARPPRRRPQAWRRPPPKDAYADLRRDLWRSLAFFAFAIVLGTLGYMRIEGWDLLDSLYMTVITLATVGYGETNPLHPAGRVFTICLIILGFTALGNFFNQLARAYSEGYFQEGLRRRRLARTLGQMEDHFIVCGFGRIGQQICADMVADGAQVIVIERDPRLVAAAREAGLVAIEGDASSDQALSQAGIERARCVLCALPSDAENLYIVVSAKLLNGKVRVIARATSDEGAAKLERVGADQVVSPYMTGAKHMAALALRPHVVNLVEAAFSSAGRVYIEELVLGGQDDCPVLGQSLGAAELQRRSGALVLALRRAGGKFIGAPAAETELAAGDMLIAMGNDEQLRKLTALVLPKGPRS